jgi:hypothetical protein
VLFFMMIALVAAMVAFSALSGSAQEENDDQYDEESDGWYDEFIEGQTKADPPDEDDSPPEPEPDPEPVCTDWLQDWYIWEDPRGVEDWWYFYWYKWCYDPAEEEWFIIWDGWEWWGPA